MKKLRTRDTVTLERFESAGTYAKGVFTKGQSITCDILANVQPVKPSEMLLLPEAQRTKETIKIFSSEALRPVAQTDSKSADRVTYDSDVYEVISTKDWNASAIPHYRSLAQRVNTNETTRQA